MFGLSMGGRQATHGDFCFVILMTTLIKTRESSNQRTTIEDITKCRIFVFSRARLHQQKTLFNIMLVLLKLVT